MKLKRFLWLVEVLSIVFWVVFLLILFFINPYRADANIFILFFVSLLLAIAGTWSVIEFRVKIKVSGPDETNRKIASSFRHGLMVALALSGLLFMRGIDVLSLWEGLVFVLAIILFEAYFMTRGNVLGDK